MTSANRLAEAARRIIEGDTSVEAARLLESVVIDDYLGDERTDQLLYSLSRYSPAATAPYVGVAELRNVLRATLATLANAGNSG